MVVSFSFTMAKGEPGRERMDSFSGGVSASCVLWYGLFFDLLQVVKRYYLHLKLHLLSLLHCIIG